MFQRSSSILWFSNKKGGGSPEKHCTLSRCSGTTLILSLLVICLLGGCGYRFSPAGEHIDKNIRKVFVDIFANRTSEANVESTFRNSFIDQFITGRRFTIVDSREAADAILKGSIESLTTSPLSYKSSNIAAEERITVTMELSFEEKVSVLSSGRIKASRELRIIRLRIWERKKRAGRMPSPSWPMILPRGHITQ